MSLDNAANFCRGSVSAVGNITATTITYTLAGPSAFPTPDANLYNPDVGYNVTIWLSGTYSSPDIDPNAAVFRVTSLTSTVLTGYWTEGTAQPTAAGTYTVIFGPTEKLREDLWVVDYALPYELLVVQANDFEAPPNEAIAYAQAAGLYFGGTGATRAVDSSIVESAWKISIPATSNDFGYVGRNNNAWDSGYQLNSSIRLAHRLKGKVNMSMGTNTNAVTVFGFVSNNNNPSLAGAGFRASSTNNSYDIFFRIDSAVSTTQLQCVCRNGTAETVINLTPSGGLNQYLILEIVATTAGATFYVNGVNEGTITTNVPTGQNMGWILDIGNTAAVTEACSIEWVKMVRPRGS